MVPSVLPWVPLPLPGAPNKTNVRYFMKDRRLYRTRGRSGRETVTKRLLCCDRIDVYASAASIEANIAVDQCENGVIPAEANIFAGQKFRAALANDDVASKHHFTAESFYAEPLANTVAAILNAALSFFVSHLKKLRVRPFLIWIRR